MLLIRRKDVLKGHNKIVHNLPPATHKHQWRSCNVYI